MLCVWFRLSFCVNLVVFLTKALPFLSNKKSLPGIFSKTVFSRTSNAIINKVMTHYLLKHISSKTTVQYLGLYIHWNIEKYFL
jgi:hypothetical protein